MGGEPLQIMDSPCSAPVVLAVDPVQHGAAQAAVGPGQARAMVQGWAGHHSGDKARLGCPEQLGFYGRMGDAMTVKVQGTPVVRLGLAAAKQKGKTPYTSEPGSSGSSGNSGSEGPIGPVARDTHGARHRRGITEHKGSHGVPPYSHAPRRNSHFTSSLTALLLPLPN